MKAALIVTATIIGYVALVALIGKCMSGTTD